MSNVQLSDILGLGVSSYSRGNLIVCEENGVKVSGKFVLHHLLKGFFQMFGTEARALLILTEETLSSWENAAQKIWLDLNKNIATEKIAVIDIPGQMYASLTRTETENSDADPVVSKGRLDLSKLYSLCVNSLCKLEQAPESNEVRQTKVLIVIESMTSLISATTTDINSLNADKSAITFLNKLLTLSESCKGETSIATCVTSVGSDISKIISEVMATCLVKVYPLKTGYSPLFNGYISVKHLAQNDEALKLDNHVKYFQYKVDSKTVQLVQCPLKFEL